MVWNSNWPVGTQSVGQNQSTGAANTTYIETTQNKDHFWNIGADQDGYHRKVSMENFAATAIGAPDDPTIPTGLEGVIYLKTTSGTVQGFYRNAANIYQFIPAFLTDSFDLTSSYQNVVAVPDETYGQFWFFTDDIGPNLAFGYFKAAGGICQAWAIPQFIGGSITETVPLTFGNGDKASGLNIRVKSNWISPQKLQYRIVYWSI